MSTNEKHLPSALTNEGKVSEKGKLLLINENKSNNFDVKSNNEIEEMANDINMHCCSLAEQFCGETSCNACLTNFLYNVGYRKQSEGHWEKDEVGETLCSQCGVRPLYRKSGTTFATTFYPTRSNYCPNCGAKMKGE